MTQLFQKNIIVANKKIKDFVLGILALVLVCTLFFYASSSKPNDSISQSLKTTVSQKRISKEKVNDALFKYYPLSVGTKWIYKHWTYRYEGDSVFGKVSGELTVTVSEIYEQGGREYVKLDKVDKIADWIEVDELTGKYIYDDSEMKINKKIPFPKDEKLVSYGTEVLEISDLTVKYVYPDYPGYIDVFPLKKGIIIDLNDGGQQDRYKSVYGEEAFIWKREKSASYVIKNKEYKNCFKSFAYDLRGNSGSKDEIVFCEGLGPIKYASELDAYAQHSNYYDLIDFVAK